MRKMLWNIHPWSPVRQGIFAAGAHSDYGMLTLLATDDAPGLQIWLHSAGRFVDVPPKPGAFIVNLGDMLERCGRCPNFGPSFVNFEKCME